MMTTRAVHKRRRQSLPSDTPHNTPSPITILPDEVIETELAPRISQLNLQTASRLGRTCQTLHRLFQPSITQQLAPILLQKVIHADWEAIKDITARHPALMYTIVNATDINNTKIRMSPLMYAFYVSDKYSLRIFEKIAHQSESLPTYCAQKQMTPAVFDFKPYYAAYQLYINNFQRMINRTIGIEELATCWYQTVGVAQATLAPRWLIKLMLAPESHGEYRWRQEASFKELEPPSNCTIQQTRYFPTQEIDVFNTGLPDRVLGVNFAISRHIYSRAAMRSGYNDLPPVGTVEFDLAATKKAVLTAQRQIQDRLIELNAGKANSLKG